MSAEKRAMQQVLLAVGLDVERMETAADKIVALAAELGVTRAEMASLCVTVGANHLVATGVSRERALLAMAGIYDWRVAVGLHTKFLVPG